MTSCQRFAEELHAYHDGELAGVRLRRLTRHLATCAPCTRELAEIARVAECVRESEGTVTAPDGLWERIALRLPAIDAQVAEEAPSARRPRTLFGRPLLWLARPVGAGLVAAAICAVVVVQQWAPPPPTIDVVRRLETRGSPVMVLPEEDGSTIIWVMDQAGDDAGSGERSVVL